jgi:hypothetical protein
MAKKKRVKPVGRQLSLWDPPPPPLDDPTLASPPAAPRPLSPDGIALTAVLMRRSSGRG